MPELYLLEKIDKTAKQIVDAVSTSVLVKTDYEQTLNMVKAIVFGLLIDIGKRGAEEKK